jgi:hypothetical protein
VRNKLKSRKFWLTVAAVLLVIANEGFGLGIPEDAYWAVIAPIMAYVFGEAYADAHR